MEINNSFMRGWMQVPQGVADTVRLEIMQALAITTRMAFLNRVKGVQTTPAEKAAIEGIFAKYGITDIWGSDYPGAMPSDIDINRVTVL